MPKMIFINLPVTDLTASTAFYVGLGATKNPQFSDENTSAIVFSDTIYAMLMTHQRFGDFTKRKIIDAHTSVQAMFALSADSRDDVDDLVTKATRSGGKADPNPSQDYGFMYGRSFEDPDGNIWEVFWMDPAAVNAPQETADAV
jgi:predicted lactoylglutathione lyase